MSEYIERRNSLMNHNQYQQACHSIALEVAKKFAVGDDLESFTKDMAEKYEIAFSKVSEELKSEPTKSKMVNTKRYY